MKSVIFRSIATMLFNLLALAVPQVALAQNYPTKTIRYIVPFPPGGVTDMMARVIAQKASDAWKQVIVVDNRPGGNGLIGADLVAKSTPDGYTWLAMTITHTVNATLFPQAPFSFTKDLKAVSVLGSLPMVMVVNPGVPAKSLAELTALGRSKSLNGGSSGNGSPAQLALELYRQLTGISVQHIPFKGSGPAIVSLLGGEIDFLIPGLPECLMHVRSGKLRALAIAGSTRHPLISQIPTTAEAGLPGLTITSWTGLMVPSRTPKDVIKRINAEVVGALRQPDTERTVRDLGFTMVANAPEEAQAFMATEVGRWGKLVREANVKAE